MMHNTCFECGKLANYVTCMACYGRPPEQEAFACSTTSMGVCKWCGRKTAVTEERDFFFPNFGLINWKKYKEMGKDETTK